MEQDERTEDEMVFGKDAWVYCNQHMKAHQTGWCTVSARDKVGLGVATAAEAPACRCRCWSRCRPAKPPISSASTTAAG